MVMFVMGNHKDHLAEMLLVSTHILFSSFRKHTFSNILKILQPKKENFKIKNSDIFHIPAQNIDHGYSLELPQ